MSRPCFALSVMLCCMAGPLLIIGKSHAQDTFVSPSHDPGECVVCPLAHSPLEPCGGYSDYDYNDYYWYDDYSPSTYEATPAADPEPELAQPSTDGTSEDGWESAYDDYYADYVYGDDATTTEADESTLEETPAPAALVDPELEASPAFDSAQGAEDAELTDEEGWYTDDADASVDYFDSYNNYEPIEPADADLASPEEASFEEATAAEAAIDYEAYEGEWFSYEADSSAEETSPEAQEVNPEADEADEALPESASDASADEAVEAPPASEETTPVSETWGDEEAWYRDEYGYDAAFDEGTEEAAADLEAGEQLETGYDEAYDDAMATDSETSEATVEPAVDEQFPLAIDAEPAWLVELVDRMLAPIRSVGEDLASNASILDSVSGAAVSADECAQQWNCELDHWAQPEPAQPSVVMTAADTLDGMAAVLQNAAEFLRGVAGGHLAETARTSSGGVSR